MKGSGEFQKVTVGGSEGVGGRLEWRLEGDWNLGPCEKIGSEGKVGCPMQGHSWSKGLGIGTRGAQLERGQGGSYTILGGVT